MPIKFEDNNIPRLRAGSEKIKRAYQGNKLVYGLYDVHYYDRDNIDNYDNIGNIYDNKLQKEYAWGYAPECSNIVLPNASYRNEYNLNGYPTHFGNSSALNGGYKDNNLSQQKNKIDLDDKQDFDFYARGRQHKYSYDGTIKYQRWEYIPPSPPVTSGLYDFAVNYVGNTKSSLTGQGDPAFQGIAGNGCAEFTWWSLANVYRENRYYPPPSNVPSPYFAASFVLSIKQGVAQGSILGNSDPPYDPVPGGGDPQQDDIVVFYDSIVDPGETYRGSHVGICSGNGDEFVSGNGSSQVLVDTISNALTYNPGGIGYVLIRGFALN